MLIAFTLAVLAAPRSAPPCRLAALPAVAVRTRPRWVDVTDFGAIGDGKTDCSAAFQRAVEVAAKGPQVVFAPRGNYLFRKSLDVPAGVTLKGVWESVPAHNGIRDAGLPKPTDDGTTFLIEFGEGDEHGAPFLTLNTNSTLKGVVIFYPLQNPAAEPKPYSAAIAMRGKNPAVLDCELLNPYYGIDASQNERHLIRNVQGQPLALGVYVDGVTDIGRIENVHFNPWWSMQPKLLAWQFAHGQAFVFGRTDWQYVLNTFAICYNVGYRFIKTKAGVCNGNFTGIGADDSWTALQVDDCAPFGLLITNGEFVSFHGPDPTMVRVSASNTGVVRFVNSAFWGPCNQIAHVEGSGTVGFSDCTFCQWDSKDQGRPALDLLSGNVLVRGCEFQQKKLAVRIGKAVAQDVLSDNLEAGGAVRVADTRR